MISAGEKNPNTNLKRKSVIVVKFKKNCSMIIIIRDDSKEIRKIGAVYFIYALNSNKGDAAI